MFRFALQTTRPPVFSLPFRSILAILTVLGCLCASGKAQTAYTGHLIGGQFSSYSPYGGAVDASGNFYFSDQLSQTVLEIPTGCVNASCAITLGGPSSFSYASGVAVDGSGNVYVADTNDSVLKEIPAGCFSDGCVTTLAGGTFFSAPYGIAVDSAGNVYFSDVNTHTVYEMTPGCGSTACITPLGFGVNGFNQPTSIAVDPSGNVYVADDGGPAVYEMTPNCTTSACVTTLGGGFSQPISVALDRFGNVYVADYVLGQVYEMPPGCPDSTCMTTVGGGYYGPTGLAVDNNSNVDVSDYLASAVRLVVRQAIGAGSVAANTATPAAFTVTFTFSSNGSNVGTPAVVTQGVPNLDFTDALTGTCNTNGPGHSYTVGDTCTVDVIFNPSHPGSRYGAVELLNGSGNPLATAYLEGIGLAPQLVFAPPATGTLGGGLNGPWGAAVDASGNVFEADTNSNTVNEIPAGCGSAGCMVALGGGFSRPQGVAVDGAGNVWVADTLNETVKEIPPGCTAANYVASTCTVASVSVGFPPYGVAVDGGGNVYVADFQNAALKEMPAGCTSASCVISLGGGSFSGPAGVAVDLSGNIYVADKLDSSVKVVSPGCTSSSCVAIIGGGFSSPSGVAVDGMGSVYVADTGNQQLKDMMSACNSSACVGTLAGGYGTLVGVAVDGSGNIYLTDQSSPAVQVINRATAASVSFATTADGAISTDSPKTVTVGNIGNTSLTFAIPGSGNNPSVSPNFSINDDVEPDCPITSSGNLSNASLDQNTSCALPISFAPTAVGTISGSVVITDDALNVPGSTQTISLSGTATVGPVTHFVIDAPNPVGSYNTYQMTITAEDAVGNTVTSYNGTVALSSSDPGFVNLGNVTFSNGIGIQNFVLKKAGTQSITATDIVNSALTGTVNLTVLPGPAVYLGISVPSSTYAGSPMSITVTAYDLVLNVATSYTGTVHFTSTDPSAVLPADYTFVAGDNGVHSFNATLKTPGAQSITTTDSADGLAPGSGNIDVTIPALVVTTTADDAGTASNCTVQTTPGTGTDASCSLRDALLESAVLGSSNITFDSTVFATAQTIAESSGTMTIPAITSITGVTSGGGVTVQGSSSGPVFSVAAGLTASISNLTITGASGGNGSGIRNNGGMLTVSSSTISNNASAIGGGIYTSGGTLTVSNSTISGNHANDSGGGGIYVGSGTVSIATSTFSGNTSTSGGGLSIAAGTVTVTNSTFSGNTASGFGGGVFNQSTSVTVTGSTFSGNIATSGGGVYNSLIMTFANSILAGNSAPTGPDFEGGATDAGHNLIGIGSSAGFNNGVNGTLVGTSASPINPMLSALGNYGGPTQTLLPLPGSPAICAGSVSLIPSGVTTDQRGFPNTNTTYPGYAPGSECVDAGAVQTNYAISFTTDPPANVSVNTDMSPAPVVTTTESGVTAAAAGSTVTMTDSASLLAGTTFVNMSGGVATFSNLQVSGPTASDTLTATLNLNGALNLTTQSVTSISSLTAPALVLSTTHTGIFMQGQPAEWDVTVGDSAAAQPTTGGITVVDTLPAGYTLSSFSGSGWGCTGPSNVITCTSTTSIGTGGSSMINLFVAVPANSPILVDNSAMAWGGGDLVHDSQAAAVTASDTGVAVQQVPFSITPSSGSFSAQVATAYTSLAVTIADAGGVPIANLSGPVVFTAVAGTGGATGTFAGPSSTAQVGTDASGVADPGIFTANSTAGTFTVGVTLGSLSAIYNMTNTEGPFSQLAVSAPPNAFAGWPITVLVTPEDQYGNFVTSFNDTLHVTSSDGAAVLPPDSTLCGCGGILVTLNTAGVQTVTVTDTANSIFGISDNIIVAIPPNLVVTTAQDDVANETNCSPQSTPGTGTDAACSLRDALNYASSFGAASITFDSTAFSAGNNAAQNTITLTNGALEIPNDTSITGVYTGAGDALAERITVSGNNLSGVLQMTDQNAQGSINGLAITGGMVSDLTVTNPYVGGAGIYNDGVLTVTNSIISGNNANGSELAFGAGIFSDNDLEISNSTISGNSDTVSADGFAYGGGIANLSYMNAANLIVSGNTASGGSGAEALGGGIFAIETDMINSTISGNVAQAPADGNSMAAGGGIIEFLADAFLVNNTIAGNTASAAPDGLGGGIYNLGSLFLLSNTISANAADDGGGLYDDVSGDVGMGNTIVSGNTAAAAADYDEQGFPDDVGGNQIAVTPMLLAALADNGGGMPTMLPLPGSPAICGGLAANLFGPTDERGFVSFNVNYPGYSAGTPCVDAGAVQTNYAIAITQQPSTSSTTATLTVSTPISPAPAASVTESGNPVNGTTVTIADADSALSGTLTQTSAAGTATFGGLSISSPQTNDTLTFILSLNGSLNLQQTSYPFDAAYVAPVLIWPTPGITLRASTQTFRWSAAGPPSSYVLKVSTLHFGGSDVFAGVTSATSILVPTIPTNGAPLYVQLSYKVNGATVSINYTYTEKGTPTPPAMITPAPSSTLSGASATFTWSAGAGPTAYVLKVGTTNPGASDVFIGSTTSTSLPVPSGIPTNGGTLYVTLEYQVGETWTPISYTYMESGGGPNPPAMINPAPGSTLTGSSVTFNWSAGTGDTEYRLRVGSTGPGSSDLYLGNPTTALSAPVSGLPTNGQPVYVTLGYKVGGVWHAFGYTYTAQ